MLFANVAGWRLCTWTCGIEKLFLLNYFFGILLVILCIFYFLFQEYRTCSSDAVDKEFASGLAVHFGQFQHAYN